MHLLKLISSFMIKNVSIAKWNDFSFSFKKITTGWMDELAFYVPSIVFQSLRDDERMNMKSSVQWSAV